MQKDPVAAHRPIMHLLDPGERIELMFSADDSEIRVTDRRLLVTDGDRVRLHCGYDDLRRVEFDLEALRPASMVIVPHQPSQRPQFLVVPRESLHHAAELIAFVGERLP